MNYTPKQKHLLSAIAEHKRQNGYAPTYKELAEKLGVSKISVFERVEALERKGALVRKKNEARSLEILDPNLQAEDNLKEAARNLVQGTKGRKLPEDIMEAIKKLEDAMQAA